MYTFYLKRVAVPCHGGGSDTESYLSQLKRRLRRVGTPHAVVVVGISDRTVDPQPSSCRIQGPAIHFSRPRVPENSRTRSICKKEYHSTVEAAALS